MSARRRRAKRTREIARARWKRRSFAAVVILALIGAVVAWRIWRPPVNSVAAPTVEVRDAQIAAVFTTARSRVLASPKSASAWGRYGMLLMAHKFHREAVACFREAARREPREPRWPYLHGTSVLAWDPQAALPILAHAAELAGDEPAAPRLRLANLLLERGRIDEAQTHVARVAARHPDDPHVLFSLGRIAVARGALRESLTHLERAAKQLPTARGANALLAAVQQRLGNVLAAQEAANQAAKLPPDRPIPDPFLDEVSALQTGMQAWLTEANRLLKAGASNEAFALFEKTVATYPDSAIAWQMLGQARLEHKDAAAAEKALRKSLALAPDVSANHFQLGTALFARDRLQEAAECYRHSIALQPDYARAHFNLGICLGKAGRILEAIEELRTALRCDPNFADAHRQLGATLLREQRFAEAAASLRRAIELNPSDRAAAEMLERISTGVPSNQ